MKKFLVLMLSALMLASLLAGCGNKGKTEENGTIVVGMHVSSDGLFESMDKDGNPSGVGVMIVKAFGEYMGKKIEIQNMDFAGLIPALQTNKIDMVLSSMTITEARAEMVDFSDPYCNAYLAILASADSDLESAEDLNQAGMKVAVTNGSTGYNYALNKLPNAEPIVLDDAGACITEVVQGKADGFIRDQLTVYRASQQNPDTTKALLIPFADAEPWGAAFNMDNDELREKFNEFLKGYKEAGNFERITNEYMKEYKEAFDELGFKWFFD